MLLLLGQHLLGSYRDHGRLSLVVRARSLFEFEMIRNSRGQLFNVLMPVQFEIVPLLAFASKLEFELLILLMNFAHEDVAAACGRVRNRRRCGCCRLVGLLR